MVGLAASSPSPAPSSTEHPMDQPHLTRPKLELVGCDGGGLAAACAAFAAADQLAAPGPQAHACALLPQLPAMAPQLGLPLPPCPPLATGLPLCADLQQPVLALAALAATRHQQQQEAAAGSGSGSGSHGSDSGDGGSGAGGAQPAGAARAPRRTSEERVTATKEKNRKAQQRFRLRQKEKARWLEGELARLRELCRAHGIDASPGAAPPQAAAAAPPQQPQQPQPGPSTQQMYEQLEALLEACPAVPPPLAIAYLAAFQRADPDARRCQHGSLVRRAAAGRLGEVATCVLCFLGGAGAWQPCGAPPVPAAAVAGMPAAADGLPAGGAGPAQLP